MGVVKRVMTPLRWLAGLLVATGVLSGALSLYEGLRFFPEPGPYAVDLVYNLTFVEVLAGLCIGQSKCPFIVFLRRAMIRLHPSMARRDRRALDARGQQTRWMKFSEGTCRIGISIVNRRRKPGRVRQRGRKPRPTRTQHRYRVPRVQANLLRNALT